jgi:hypothetical protein
VLVEVGRSDLYRTYKVGPRTLPCGTPAFIGAWEFAAEIYLLKLQRLQNKVLRTIGNLLRCPLVHDMQVAFQISYVYDYITKLCRRQAEIIHNHENGNVCNIGQSETPHRKHKRLKLGGGHVYDRSSD